MVFLLHLWWVVAHLVFLSPSHSLSLVWVHTETMMLELLFSSFCSFPRAIQSSYFAWCLVCLWRICEQRSIESCKGRNEEEAAKKEHNIHIVDGFRLRIWHFLFLIRLFIYTHSLALSLSLHLSSAHWAMRWCVAYNICVYICFGT